MSSLITDNEDYNEISEESLSPPPEGMVRGSSIPQGATPTFIDFGETPRRGMPLGSEVSGGLMSAEQPVMRSIQAASFGGLPDTLQSLEKGIANMSATVMHPGAHSFDPLAAGAGFDLMAERGATQLKPDGKNSLSTNSGSPGFLAFWKFSSAPTLPSFDEYNEDHFQYGESPERLQRAFEQILVDLEFDFVFDANRFEYELTSYPGDNEVIVLVSVYRDMTCGHVVSFSRLNGRRHYRQELAKVWNALHEQGFVAEPMVSEKPFNGFLPDMEPREPETVSKETIKPVLKMVQSKMLDVRCTGAQMIASALKNPATTVALKESGAVGCLFSVLKSSGDDRVDQLVTAALRNATVALHEDIRNEYQGIKYLVEKLESCSAAKRPEALKTETGRNCAKILIELAGRYGTEIKQANGRAVATGIAADPNASPVLVTKAKDLLQALSSR
jgi:hypothetical protein